MSQQRRRHLDRQPIEETVRLAISAFVGLAGQIDVERHAYDWRQDDLLVWIRLHQPIAGTVLTQFRREVAQRMRDILPEGQQFDDWLVVVEYNGESTATVAWDDIFEDAEQEAGGA